MGLLDIAKRDIEQITSDLTGFAAVITLTDPGTSEQATVNGLHTKHHLSIDTDGNQVNTKNAHISFSEANLILANALYPIRNANAEVDLQNHRVDVKDSTGVSKQYVIRQWFPDETIGLIVCILGDHE